MTSNQFRLELHQIINELEFQLKSTPVRNYSKVYKDSAVIRIMNRAEKVRYARAQT